jgi:Pyruvate/2-oxoacid:ferredoxin oxidoreductase gamma subunit
VERELIMAGIGGQGVQLASSVLGGAAVREGLQVQLFGSYGGMMRGGATEATIVFGEGPIESPPTSSSVWSAVVMHHEHSGHAMGCLVPGSIVFFNNTVVHGELVESALRREDLEVVEVPATEIAIDLGNATAATMVMIGAYAAATGIVGPGTLEEALREALPPYRRQHIELNDRALAAGASAVDHLCAAAWPSDSARVRL